MNFYSNVSNCQDLLNIPHLFRLQYHCAYMVHVAYLSSVFSELTSMRFYRSKTHCLFTLSNPLFNIYLSLNARFCRFIASTIIITLFKNHKNKVENYKGNCQQSAIPNISGIIVDDKYSFSSKRSSYVQLFHKY